MAQDTIYKVKYIGGSGVRLETPLEDGRVDLPGHKEIELTSYRDFVRLTSHPCWIDCTPQPEPDAEAEAPVADAAPKSAMKKTEAGS